MATLDCDKSIRHFGLCNSPKFFVSEERKYGRVSGDYFNIVTDLLLLLLLLLLFFNILGLFLNLNPREFFYVVENMDFMLLFSYFSLPLFSFLFKFD